MTRALRALVMLAILFIVVIITPLMTTLVVLVLELALAPAGERGIVRAISEQL